MRRRDEPPMLIQDKIKMFLVVYWRGILCVLAPLLALPIILPPPVMPYNWCAFCLVIMGIYWVSECIPLPVTSFLPFIIFPLVGVATTSEVSNAYMNDTLIMFLGSLILANSIEQSGLHKRLAYGVIRAIGFTHYRLLFAMSFVTMFVSMWITNTAATTMMIPINFAVLKVFEQQKLLKMYNTNSEGEKVATDITACYFCAATYSATIGGIGTLVGTATNLAMRGLFQGAYKNAPDLISFPKFSFFTIIPMLLMESIMYLAMTVQYLGFLRPKSDAAKLAVISPEGEAAAKKAVEADWKKLGRITFWEIMVIILFGGAMILFFGRSPQLFQGWGDAIESFFELPKKFVKDSALAIIIGFLMFLLPANLNFFKNFTAKYHEDMPNGPVPPVLDWKILNASLPYSFAFLLGGGFALSDTAKSSGLNDKIGEALQVLEVLPNIVVLLIVIIVVIFITNFASNVVVCNVFAPIAMQLAKQIGRNPLLYALASGISASFCFLLPVGTPGNLIVQSAAKIATTQMIIAGVAPTITAIIVLWIFICFWAPVVWPDVNEVPDWANQ